MADWYAAVIAELYTIILATLPEITTDAQIFTVNQALQRNIVSDFQEALEDDPSVAGPPYVFIAAGKVKPDNDGSTDGNLFRLQFDFYYICAESATPATLDQTQYAHSRLNVLATILKTNTASTFQWGGTDGDVDSSSDIAFADENMQLFAGKLGFEDGFQSFAL